MSFSFNTGTLYMVTPTGAPVEAALLQNLSLDFSGDLKALYGQNRFAELNALGQGKIEGKAETAGFDPLVMNTALAGLGTITTGQYIQVQEAVTLSSSVNNYTVTNASKYYKDLGVKDVSNPIAGVPMNFISTGTPATGQYALDGTTAGKYNFAAADGTAKKSLLVKYLYQDTTSGQTITLQNQPMGLATYFSMLLSGILVDKSNVSHQVNVWLNACVSNKLSLAWKLGDWNIPNFDFSAQSDSAGGLGWISIGANNY